MEASALARLGAAAGRTALPQTRLPLSRMLQSIRPARSHRFPQLPSQQSRLLRNLPSYKSRTSSAPRLRCSVVGRLKVTAAASAPAKTSIADKQETPSSLADLLPEDKEGSTPEVKAIVLDVSGMKCAGCSAAVKRMIEGQPDVERATVNLITETAAVWLYPPSARESSDDDQQVAGAAAAVVSDRGFPCSVRPFGVEAAAAAAAAAQANRQAEIRESNFDLAYAWLLVCVCGGSHLGHLLHLFGMHEYAHGPVLTALGESWVGAAIAAVSVAGPGRKLMVDGFRAAVNGAPNMNTLVALGCSSALTISVLTTLLPDLGWAGDFSQEPVMLLAVVLLGRSLERNARARASSDLEALASLLPAAATLILNYGSKPAEAPSEGAEPSAQKFETVSVPTGALRAGDIVQILPGDRIPVDGVVLRGASSVDESMLTGESVPVVKRAEAEVTGGTVNCEGALVVQASEAGEKGALSGIAQLVQEAQGRQASVQQVADRVVGPFVQTIVGLSLSTFVFWSTVGAAWYPEALDAGGDQAPLFAALKLAVDVMVVACPCALGLATPTAVLVGTSMGARRGVLMKGADVLERAAEADVLVFDKTGTLTEGKPRVLGAVTLAGDDSGVAYAGMLEVAAAVEMVSRHPVAAAIVAAADEAGVQYAEVEGGRTEVGFGALGRLPDGRLAAVGKREWVEARVQAPPGAAPEADVMRRLQAQGVPPGSTVVWVGAEGGGVLGAVALGDTLRPDAAEAADRLQALGLRLVLMSGDAQASVQAVAGAVGIEEAHWEMLPADKAAAIQRLQAEGQRVIMVGDGANDAPALATAHVGVALSRGVEAAGEAASAVLLGERLSQVVDLVGLGRATLGKIQQNLLWALGYNALGIPLAAGALLPAYGVSLNPSAAGAMMAFSSVAVVTNSVLLRMHSFENVGSGSSNPRSTSMPQATNRP